MTVDPHTPALPPQQPPCRAKVRLRFRKDGSLRLISHHDLMHCFERMFRRAELRVHTTQGFHPKPRVVFAQSLALGIVGCREVVELELDDPLPPDEIQRLLSEHAPPGLEILEAKSIEPRAKAAVRRAGYRATLPPDICMTLENSVAAFLATSEYWIERTRPQPRRLNIRPYVSSLKLQTNGLEMLIWVTPNGTVRPDEVVRALGLEELLDQGLIIERHVLELEDEMTATELEQITIPPALILKAGAKRARADSEQRPTALMPGPLAFDS